MHVPLQWHSEEAMYVDEQIIQSIVQSGFESDIFVKSSLVDIHVKFEVHGVRLENVRQNSLVQCYLLYCHA
jgi:hypothetical protein